MDDTGARRLIAAILKQAHDDFDKSDGCPVWCTVIDTCNKKRTDKNFCDARTFIHSSWCAAMCDELNIDHDAYTQKVIQMGKLSRDTYKYIESELRNYKKTCQELEVLKRDVILQTTVKQEGNSYTTSDTTFQRTAEILKDKKIQKYQERVDAIKHIYDRCDDNKKKLIEMKYWQNRYTDEGISYHLGVDRKTVYHWKQAIIYAIAVELGYL